MDRRVFLQSMAAGLVLRPDLALGRTAGPADAVGLRKAVLVSMLPKDLPYALLVPAVVDQTTSYRDAWTRSQQVIRERLLPLARELKVIVAVEEVWNKFLLSPLEFARYVDELDSPWLKVYFDVGNVVFYGYPQDWIRSLGPRIAKVHLKDFRLDRPNGRFAWTNIGDGDIDWLEVRRAFDAVGYRGYCTTEVAGGDAAYLKDLAGRVDRFLAGQKPA